MPGINITSKLPDGWERSQTNIGIPYYINHEYERTQWDHPEMTSLMEEIDGLSNIKYAAYRTAMKLRAIQKKTQLYMVDLPVIIAALDEEGIGDGYAEGNLSVSELLRVLTSIFMNQNDDCTDYMDISLSSELLLNWILNVYDPYRTGFVHIVSLKIGLAVMCSAKVQDKYRYIFRQLSTNHRYLDRRGLKTFLQEMLEIPKYIYESAAFSGSSLEPAIRNCFETVSIPEQVSVGEFVEWMTAEPQTIVWLPTLHRLAVSETVKHESKCNVCKMYPIVGFRYRCLKCFNFDLCQECFWSGRVNKQHKIGHPTQEYCLVSTQKEDLKDFAKVVRNKVSKKKKAKQGHPSKGRYIPIGIEDTVPSDGDEDDYVDAPVTMKTFPGTHDKLGSYAARLADHESRMVEEEYKESPPLPRDAMDDEDHFIQPYTNSLSGELEVEVPYSSPATTPLDSKEKRDLENLILTLEEDNRALLGEIANIRHLERRGQEERAGSDAAEATFLREQRARLEARQEVLEAHNHQLQVQLHRLRTLLHQEETTLCSLIKEEDKMATLFARERVKRFRSEATKKTQTGDLSQISSFLKSNQSSQPHSKAALPENTSVATMTGLIPTRSLGISGEDVSSSAYRTTSTTPRAAAFSVSPVPKHTFPSSMSSTRAYRPEYSLSPSIPPPGSDASWQTQPSGIRRESPDANTPLSARVGGGAFALTTAAELGLLDRPDSSVEGMEMSNIVDRMTAAFPLDDYKSDIPVDVHNDLFLAAGLIGEALQSMVTTISRATGAAKTSLDSRKPYKRDLDEPAHGLDNLGYGDWPLTDLEGSSNRHLIHSSTGYEYGPL